MNGQSQPSTVINYDHNVSNLILRFSEYIYENLLPDQNSSADSWRGWVNCFQFIYRHPIDVNETEDEITFRRSSFPVYHAVIWSTCFIGPEPIPEQYKCHERNLNTSTKFNDFTIVHVFVRTSIPEEYHNFLFKLNLVYRSELYVDLLPNPFFLQWNFSTVNKMWRGKKILSL